MRISDWSSDVCSSDLFIDEIFLPQKPLLEALVGRDIQFGIQTRIDLWKPDLLRLLGRAGCVSIEAGVESLPVEGREALAKRRTEKRREGKEGVSTCRSRGTADHHKQKHNISQL